MKITHVLADGTVLDSIEGHVVPPGNEALKQALMEILKRKLRENKQSQKTA